MTVLTAEVAGALRGGDPVVALETTLVSHGFSGGRGFTAALAAQERVRAAGAVPATIGIVDGTVRVGLDDAELERFAEAGSGARKVGARDIAACVVQGALGATTVGGTLAVCRAAGIRFLATGGIGGVHRGAELTGDISADLDALANHPVITVCAGAKAFLDLARTLEYLETAGVPVLGWQHDWFPAFYLRSSGLRVPHRVESASVVADVLLSRVRERTGVLLTVPIPPADELDPQSLNSALDAALAECEAARITGAAVTPFILGRIEQQTAGASIPANLALAENNARVAAAVAGALTRS
jgi:pseudouridine-5'-phosphate glycosidase